jgi:MoCo/4Fe-4S cofactor protein with predicted Tat translocation signal
MAHTKKYWTGLEELHQTEAFKKSQENEFEENVSVDKFLSDPNLNTTSSNRRDFLKFLGFSVTAAALASCETPIIKSIPYVVKPEEITPGVANYYASTFYDGTDFANILVKTREGRPIFIKGNKFFGSTYGAVTPRVNASVLSIYDSARLQQPIANKKESTWSEIDKKIKAELQEIASAGGSIRVLTNSVISPSTNTAIDAFLAHFNTPESTKAKRITYDAISNCGMRKANATSFGKASIPSYNFDKAKTIVSIGADFLANWLMHTEYILQYKKGRNPETDSFSMHTQFESIMSLTGSNADRRVQIKPSQEGTVAGLIYNQIAKAKGLATLNINKADIDEKVIALVAKDLLESGKNSLVVAGSNDPSVQTIVNAINNALGAYGNTIDFSTELSIKQGSDKDVITLVEEMRAGKVDVLLVYGCNPSYSLPNAEVFTAALSKVKTSISFSLYEDETGAKCKYVCPDNHFLESWNDFYPKTGHYAIAQPTINQLYNTRQAQQSFLSWAGNDSSYLNYMKMVWSNYASKMGNGAISFDDFWNQTIHNGSFSIPVAAEVTPNFVGDVTAAATNVNKASSVKSDFEVVFYSSTAIGDGTHANNPWLQELPDPITKVTWDNYITMSPGDVDKFGFNQHLGQELPASMANIKIGGKSVTLPVVPQPGQKLGTVGVALGYGRGANGENIGKSAFRIDEDGEFELNDKGFPKGVGENMFPFVAINDGCMVYSSICSIEAANATYPIATTQTQHTLMGRNSVLRETTYGIYKSGKKEAYNPAHTLAVEENGKMIQKPIKEVDLWEKHPVEDVGHRWGMSIDLSSCIGCGSCITACHSENNVPVVGKDEIRRGRDMHWMRIDRYYTSDMTAEKAEEEGLGDIDMYRKMEVPSYDNPKAVHMPMMCQHCNHAPCETVCPVAATTHSNEGINQMTYNRCIGTRYCANNCPYKVRRFNWFNYRANDKFKTVNPAQDEISRMVLNPDVTVRARGVMEKCSMCMQRIQAGKLEAKKASKPVADGLIVSACAEACPTNAIKFGDINDTKSAVKERMDNTRTYFALEEVGAQPNISYMVKVRNDKAELA